MLGDLKYALRALGRIRAWTLMVILSLALGIGANTALFTAANGLVLRSIPVTDPDTLVRLRHVGRNQMANGVSEYGATGAAPGTRIGTTFSHPMFLELRRANQTMADLAAGAPGGQVNAIDNGAAEIATSYLVSGNFYDVIGVRAIIGRTTTAEDDQPGAPPVAVISHGFWTRRFGRDPGVVGRTIHANNVPVTIVGVLPGGYTGIQRPVGTPSDLYFPVALDPRINPQPPIERSKPRLQDPTYWWLQLMGRLRPGITAAQVEGNLAGVFEQAARDGFQETLASLPSEMRSLSFYQDRTEVSRLQVSSGAGGFYDPSPAELRTVRILGAVVALILMIVCANVANLQLSRAAARRREISVRLSLGATRGRIVRQLLTESIVLGLAGAAAGLVVAHWGKALIPGATGESPLDWRVLAFAAALGCGGGLLFGLAPALRATTRDVASALKEHNRTLAGSRGLLGRTLLVVQVAICLVLLAGAGLFLRTVDNLRRVDVGFNPDNLVLFRINPQLNGYDPAAIRSLYGRMRERLQTVPGVAAVTLANPPLLSGSVNTTRFFLQGAPVTRGEADASSIHRVRVGANFFETMEIGVVAGRAFSEADGESAPRVGIVNEAAVRKFFDGGNPIGRRFGGSPETSGEIEIVGVVEDARYNSLREEAPATMFVPYSQGPPGATAVAVRTGIDSAHAVASIREAMREVDARVPLINVTTQVEQIELRFAQERLFARAYALFGGLALLVAAVGLFGLMSYAVARRTNEIGVRMALGAERQMVVRMIMGESLILVGVGVAIGVAGALAAGRLLAAQLFGLEPADPATLALASLLLMSVSTLAGYLPARRAAQVDPIVALRDE